MATTTTLEVLLERVTENLWPGKHAVKVTATGGGLTSFVASGKVYSSGHANAYDGVYIYILDTTDDLAPEGEISQVTAAGFAPSTGTWTVSPAYTVAPASGDVGLFLYGLHSDEILDGINDVQRHLTIPRILPLTLAAGGDMEGAVTDFTDVGVPTTKEMVTTTANVLLRQSLHLVADTDVGKRTASINIHEIEQLFLSVAVRVPTGSCKVVLYDATASAAIKTVTVNETDWQEVRFYESPPASCEQIQVRVLGGAAASDFYVGWISLLYRDRGVYDLPSTIADASEVQDVLYLPGSTSGDTSDVYLPLQDALRPWPYSSFPRDWRGAHTNRIAIDQAVSRPIFVQFRTASAALAALTDTTVTPQEIIVQGALAACLRRLRDRTLDPARKGDYEVRRRIAQRNYDELLDKHGLGRPEPKLIPQRRVAVP